MSSIIQSLRIPFGSTVTYQTILASDSPSDQYVAMAQLYCFSCSDPFVQYSATQLANGTTPLAIDKNGLYTQIVFTFVGGETKVELLVKVRKPDGSEHGKTRKLLLSGSDGQSRITLHTMMVQS